MSTSNQEMYHSAVQELAIVIAYATAMVYCNNPEIQDDLDDEESFVRLDEYAEECNLDAEIETLASMFNRPLEEVQQAVMNYAENIDIHDFVTAIELKKQNRLS